MLDMKKIVEIVNSLGYKSFTFDYSIYNNYIMQCMNWYKSDVPGFHTYKRYTGASSVYRERAKLYMAKRACEDIASLTANENMILNIEDEAEKEFLLGHDEMTGILGQNDIWASFNKTMELTAALGTSAMEIIVENLLQVEDKLIPSKHSKIKIARYDALHILPLSWDNNGKIIEVAFIDEYKIKNDTFLELRLHVKNDEGNYVIVNRKCKVSAMQANSNVNQFIYLDNSSMLSEFNTGSNIPWFTCFKMPQVNSYAIEGPLGASCYGDAVDVLKGIDNAFDTLCAEFMYSRKKIYMDKSILQRDEKTGRVIIPDDDDFIKDVFFFTGSELKENPGAGPIEEKNFTIRSKEITEGIETLLDIFSSKVGLGHGYYKFSTSGVQKTATEVVSQNSDLYRNICKIQLGIEKNIYEIVQALLYVSNYIFGTKFNLNCKMSVTFDASLIEDKTKERERCLKEVELGLLTVDEYRSMYYPELGDKQEVDLTKDV